jgi:hypothetical protein
MLSAWLLEPLLPCLAVRPMTLSRDWALREPPELSRLKVTSFSDVPRAKSSGNLLLLPPLSAPLNQRCDGV